MCVEALNLWYELQRCGITEVSVSITCGGEGKNKMVWNVALMYVVKT